jgi:hypothetical protein
MTQGWAALALLALAVTAAGCDDDDDGGTGPETTGIAIDVTVTNLPEGEEIDVLVDGSAQFTVNGNGTTELTMEDIAADTYVVTLGVLPVGCVGTPDENVVTVSEGEVEEVAFTVTCAIVAR